MSTILRSFARTGLMLSPVTLGPMEFGSKIDEAEAGKVVRLALDCGVNVFDTANVYASGRSEEILGRPHAVRNHVAMAGRAAGPLQTGAGASLQSRSSW
jgi:aryl-alcohol dehydrogenase-like predicted oxidoreductase